MMRLTKYMIIRSTVIVLLLVITVIFITNKDDSDTISSIDIAGSSDSSVDVNGSELNEYLVNNDEKVIISFLIDDSNTRVTLCTDENESKYISFRMGIDNKLEYKFPIDYGDSWREFAYSYYLRGGSIYNDGLDLNYIKFSTLESEYEIYQEYSSEEKTFDIGLNITDKITKKLVDHKAVKGSITGDLSVLRKSKLLNDSTEEEPYQAN